MSNPLYNMLKNNSDNTNILQRFQRFRQSFHGDPQRQVQELLNSGKITQQQYDQAVQQAKALQKMLGI